MKVYFIRHGETESNTKRLLQGNDTTLTENGKSQARFLGNRFSKIPIDVILCSKYKRAKQTAKIINENLNKKIIHTDYLAEKRWPNELIGKEFKSSEYLKFREAIMNNLNNPGWYYSNEENLFDFRERASQFIDFLDERKEENILAISHGSTIRMIIVLMMFGKNADPDNYLKSAKFLMLNNTGIIFCEKNKENRWELITWNDHAHLG